MAVASFFRPPTLRAGLVRTPPGEDRGAARIDGYAVTMSRRPPFGLRPQDARFLVLYLGLATLMFGSLGLALALPHPLSLVMIFGLVVAGAYGLARLYVSYR